MTTKLLSMAAAGLCATAAVSIHSVALAQQPAPPVYSPDGPPGLTEDWQDPSYPESEDYPSDPYADPYEPYEPEAEPYQQPYPDSYPGYDPAYDASAQGEIVDMGSPVGDEVWDTGLFHDELAPYGTWTTLAGVGRVFRPSMAGFRPYYRGYWAYTDYGFTWVSDEPFAWAVYHYGRWIWHAGYWYWVPDTVWGPAWVSWRYVDNYVVWVPLSIDYRRWPVPHHAWHCVRWRDLTRRDLHRYYQPRHRVVEVVRHARPLARYGRSSHGHRWVIGPSPALVRARGVHIRPQRLPERYIGRLDRDHRRVLIERAQRRGLRPPPRVIDRPNERVPARRPEEVRRREAQERWQRDRQDRQRIDQERRLRDPRDRQRDDERRLRDPQDRQRDDQRRLRDPQDRQRIDQERQQREQQYRQRIDQQRGQRDQQYRQRVDQQRAPRAGQQRVNQQRVNQQPAPRANQQRAPRAGANQERGRQRAEQQRRPRQERGRQRGR